MIERLKMENFMGIIDLEIRPAGPMVTISGPNGAGKSSVFNGIQSVMRGKRGQPAKPIREGAEESVVELDVPGLRAVGKWTQSGYYLTVRSEDGTKIAKGQEALDAFFGELTFDPLAFQRQKPKEQNEVFARLVGIDLPKHDATIKALYDRRADVNRRHKAEKARLDAMHHNAGCDAELSADSLSESIRAAQDARRKWDDGQRAIADLRQKVAGTRTEIEYLRQQLADAERRLATTEHDLVTLTASAPVEPPDDMASIQSRMREIEQHNAKVRHNKDRASLAASVSALDEQSKDLTAEMDLMEDGVRRLISRSKLPIPGLAFTSDGPTLNGVPLAQCCTAEQIEVSVAVGMALNPKAPAMFVREGSLLDDATTEQLTKLAEKHGIQVWREVVTNGEPVGFTIHEGRLAQ